MASTPIQHVSDTALWVATYRAIETERPDALFRDPFASRLVGERGREIVRQMHKIGSNPYVKWSVVIRTCIIDQFIKDALAQGADMVLNLGAGLDTRPYRMELPSDLLWVEVDYPSMIEHKEGHLKSETPHCKLERVKLDLSRREERMKLFNQLNSRAKKVFVITEGVVPYLSVEETASLADDLRAQDHFKFWVVDYLSKQVMKYIQKGRFQRQMKNAPFKFNPEDWRTFFESHHWGVKELRYIGEESLKCGRKMPLPWWAKIMGLIMSNARKKMIRRMTGYAVLEQK
jgi:methyltransferase (TIGR00027 family)